LRAYAELNVLFVTGQYHPCGGRCEQRRKLPSRCHAIPVRGRHDRNADGRYAFARAEAQYLKYFLVAILFVLFDVEVIFFYPYAVNFKALGWSGFWAVLMFVGFFLCGFIYIIKKGALKWED
jgi:hypothetical protein